MVLGYEVDCLHPWLEAVTCRVACSGLPLSSCLGFPQQETTVWISRLKLNLCSLKSLLVVVFHHTNRFKTRTTSMHKKKAYRPVRDRNTQSLCAYYFCSVPGHQGGCSLTPYPSLYTYSFAPLAIPLMTRVGYTKSPGFIDLGVGFGGTGRGGKGKKKSPLHNRLQLSPLPCFSMEASEFWKAGV